MYYALENEQLSVQVNDYGAELWSVYDKKRNIEHLWQGEASIWPRRAPIVFPVCGEFADRSYTIDGTTYHMAVHGFGRDFVHDMVEKTENSLRFRLTADAKTKAIYPFDFTLDSIFTLCGDTLTHTFEVTNTGNEILPFSIGYHTGYRCFHAPEESITDCELRFDVAEPTILALDAARVAEGKPSLLSADGKTMQIVPGLFVDSIVFTNPQFKEVTFYNRNTKRGIKVHAEDYPTYIMWSIVEGMDYLCLEPWHGEKETSHDYGAFANKPGFRLLPEGETFTCTEDMVIVGE